MWMCVLTLLGAAELGVAASYRPSDPGCMFCRGMRLPHLNRLLSIAVTKHCDQEQLTEKWVYFGLQFQRGNP